ncbi:hypothetical protein ACQ7EN_02540 [Leuconostoc lactis]|uniref:hypothetical protein n=1 Tax=Leuconostoc lactis TaxID=1246 RepID=UPI003D6B7507
MKVVDKQVFIVGYRYSDNESWQTSGSSYSNLEDAVANANTQMFHMPKLRTKVFKMGRAVPVEE